MINRTYSASEARGLCGYNRVAMLDYLERQRVFVPEVKRLKIRGKARQYTFKDLVVLRAIKTLLDHGASVHALRDSLTKFQALKLSIDPGALEGPGGAIRYMFADGKEVYCLGDLSELIELSRGGQLAFSFMVDLNKIHVGLCADVKKLPERRKGQRQQRAA